VTWKRAAVAVFIIAWIGAITYSVTAGGTSPERLNDNAARTVELNCRTARHALARLPQLHLASPEETAVRLDHENAIFTLMISRQREVDPEKKDPTTAMHAWLDDWKRLITAREHFASDLRTEGRDARFVEPAYKGVDPIADKMNDWILEQGTRTNTCNTDKLQVEVVNGPRDYTTPKSQ
jgi:hypothetical protein